MDQAGQTKEQLDQINFVFFKTISFLKLSHVMRKPVYAICEQQRRRSACAFAQSDQCLCCLLSAKKQQVISNASALDVSVISGKPDIHSIMVKTC